MSGDSGTTSPSNADFDRPASPVQEDGAAAHSLHFGRPYSNQVGGYRFPIDQDEVIRLDRVHHVLRSLPGLYRGPVEQVLTNGRRFRRVLDIGCGTGMWLIEMAARFPDADCVGIDAHYMQRSTNQRNVTFMRVDAPRGIDSFAAESFDVVHVRLMIYAIADYHGLLQQAYRVLRPGGVLLVHEPNFQCYSVWEGYTPASLAPALVKWHAVFQRSLLHHCVNMSLFDRIEELMSLVGFSADGIDAYFHYRPVCPCDYTVEARHETECTRALVAASKALVTECGELSPAEFDELQRRVLRELNGGSLGEAGGTGGRGVYSLWGYWWAQK